MSHVLHAGFGRRDITPKLGTELMGYPVQGRTAEAIRDPLHATALVLQQEDLHAVVINADLAVPWDEDVATVRRKVQERTGIEADRIMVAYTQTHSAPRSLTCWGWCERDDEYMDWAIERMIEAVVEAKQSLKPTRVSIGTTPSEVGVNRRGVDLNGNIALSYNPWGIIDPEMTVMRFESAGKALGTLIHYGAHPTVLAGDSRVVSRDWPGIMIDRVEHFSGAPAIFINGAVGDIAPRSNFQSCVGDGEVALRETGGRAALDAMKAFRAATDFQELQLLALAGSIELPYRPLPTLGEAKAALKRAEPNKEKYGMGKCDYTHWQAVIAELERTPRKSKVYQQTLIGLGPVALVPFPGEPFAETVLRLRQFSPFRYTLCASTTNGSNGYLVTRESLNRGGYEVDVARAFSPYILAENIDDILVKENVALLRKLKASGE